MSNKLNKLFKKSKRPMSLIFKIRRNRVYMLKFFSTIRVKKKKEQYFI